MVDQDRNKNKLNTGQNTNHLIHETSPYLLQHAHNPVDWHPWGKEALQSARKQNKPIFLSIGYSACHWCHVMEQESFSEPKIADILNENFINIKVDREERPDIDEIYMNAVQMMTGSGGWPLSLWLTPDLQPFVGGTYFPPEDRWGRVGFKNILLQIIQVWQNQRGQIFKSADEIARHIKIYNRMSPSATLATPKIWHNAFQELTRNFDEKFGGFGAAPKFPQATTLSFLLRYYFNTKNETTLKMVETTLQHMANGGIYDQLGGGFHRYSTDEKWLVPHFEKMLYDNALLANAYLEAFQITQNPFYEQIARHTLDYVMREMTAENGGFYSAQDADSEGEEGKYYVWDRKEIEQILGEEEAKIVCAVYDVTTPGNWDGKNILHIVRDIEELATQFELSSDELNSKLKQHRGKLLAERTKRTPPMTDTKIITAWNSLMISAFCKAYQVVREDKYLKIAQSAIDNLLKNAFGNNTVFRLGDKKQKTIPGYLTDYAFFVAALIDFYESSFDPYYLIEAVKINQLMMEKFWDESDGGFFFTASDQDEILVRTRKIHDNVIPSGHSVAAANLIRLSQFTGDFSLKKKTERTIKTVTAQLEKYPLSFTYLLTVLESFWSDTNEIVISGKRGTKKTDEMISLISKLYFPNKVVGLLDVHFTDKDKARLDRFKLFEGKYPKDEQSKMYICENQSCQAPITQVADFLTYYNDKFNLKTK